MGGGGNAGECREIDQNGNKNTKNPGICDSIFLNLEPLENEENCWEIDQNGNKKAQNQGTFQGVTHPSVTQVRRCLTVFETEQF